MTTRRYFGTDGVRGVAGEPPMSAAFAFRLGVAAAEVLRQDGELGQVLIGLDTRRSGEMLAHALTAGLTSRGAEVVWLGVIPTPGVAFLTRVLGASAGIVVSASHNPFADNGIKLFGRSGEKLPDAVEARIEGELTGIEELAPVTGNAIGRSSTDPDAAQAYYRFLLEHAPRLDGMHVGLDCANGASYRLAPRLFQELGARLELLHTTPDGSNINVASGSTQPQQLQQRVQQGGLSVGIAFDGDADRAILVDARGRLVTGDHMLAICALERQETQVVSTVMANVGVEEYLAARGVTMTRTAVGDRYVAEALKQGGLQLGGEPSGHLLFLDKATTGDGMLTALETLAAVQRSGWGLERWVDELPLYPQVLLSVQVAPGVKLGVTEREEVQAALRAAQAQLAGQGRVNLRPSGTEPLVRVMVEGPEQALVERVAQEIAAVVERLT